MCTRWIVLATQSGINKDVEDECSRRKEKQTEKND